MLYRATIRPMGRRKGESNESYNARHREEQRRIMELGRTAEERRKTRAELASIDVTAKPEVQVVDPSTGGRSVTELLPELHDRLLAAVRDPDVPSKEISFLASALRSSAQAVRTAQNVVLRTDVQLVVDMVWEHIPSDVQRKLIRTLRGIDAATLLR